MTKAMPIVQKIQCLAKRLESARDLVERDSVAPAGLPDLFMVSSSANTRHRVCSGRLDQAPECACPDFRYRGESLDGWCKHRLAVELYLEGQPAESVSGGPRNAPARSQGQLERELVELF